MPALPKRIKRLLTQARRDQSILAVILFGSRARNEETPASDLDICLVLHPFDALGSSNKTLRAYLRYLDYEVDLHVFQKLPLYVRSRVLKEGKVLYVRDEDLLYDVAFRTVQAYEDFKPIYQSYLKETARA